MLTAGELLSHPLVLRAAWERVQTWYHSAEWRPELEYADWRLDPERHLFKLGKSLRDNKYECGEFHVVPYPKKGASLRHYCMPCVEDQVAFAVLGLLLAPIAETLIPTFAFGNRWYRGSYRNRRLEKPVWEDLPYDLGDRHFYQPYPRDYALFRRVCHWSAARMLGEEGDDSISGVPSITPADYPEGRLPPFVKDNWWNSGPKGKNRKGYWAHVDLQLTYPSVSIEYLERQLKVLLQASSSAIRREAITGLADFGVNGTAKREEGALRAYPSDVRSALMEQDLRLELGERLIDLLGQVRYRPISGVGDAWVPPHASQRLPLGDGEGHPGLPTGLALSGLLANVYLHTLDRTMANWLVKLREDGGRAAFVRFADDRAPRRRGEEPVM